MYSDELNELAEEKLDRMGSFYPEPAKEFRKELFCFIAACKSSIDAVLGDYAEKYKLQIKDAVDLEPKVFRELAINANNADALRFINWYDPEIKRLDRENKVWNHLVDLRRDNAGNLAIHKRKSPRITTSFLWGERKKKTTGCSTALGRRMSWRSVQSYTTWSKDSSRRRRQSPPDLLQRVSQSIPAHCRASKRSKHG